jgi:hypothetical protein
MHTRLAAGLEPIEPRALTADVEVNEGTRPRLDWHLLPGWARQGSRQSAHSARYYPHRG